MASLDALLNSSPTVTAGAPVVGAVPTPGTRAARFDATALYEILALFFTSRLLILAAAELSRNVLIRGIFEEGSERLLEAFVRWDANWYLDIATSGYTYNPTGQSSVGFYPLLPLCIRGLMALGMDPLVAGYTVSHVALLGGCLLLWKLTALETGSREMARAAVLFLLFYPGSYWFSMVYTESLFLFTMLACVFAARRGRWLLAGLAGYAAALTRTPGLFAAGFLGLEALQQLVETRRAASAASLERPGWGTLLRTRWAMLAGIAGPVLGHVTFLAFLQWRFGDWRAQQKTFAAGWHIAAFQAPWRILAEGWNILEPFFRWVTYPLIALLVVLGAVSWFAFRRWGYPALVFALTALFISSTNLRDFPRYSTTVIPIFPALGYLAVRLPVLKIPLLVFSTMLLTLLTVLLINGYHIN